ncbi:hypothetical protein F5Y11DRAFT_176033 [Daldinia sp. FL1419]|nr:hypothetical protein F5Y11DRAFT_176033 [Daldinia sp. FL1419]
MLRARLRRVTLKPRSNHLPGTGPSSKRVFGTGFSISGNDLPPVPILKPTLWALAATTSIILGCAAYDVHRDIQAAKRQGLLKNTSSASYEELEDAKRRGHSLHSLLRSPLPPQQQQKWHPSGQIGAMLAGHNDAEKLALGFSALNISLVGASSLAPAAFMQYFAHAPCISPNFTLLTSIFGHAGLLHVGMNTLALLQLVPDVARSRTFAGNGSHFAAFYLASGVLASWGNHLATTLPTRTYRVNRLVPGLGASGVVCATLGAWAMMYPDARLGIMFIPGSYSVNNFLTGLVLFDLWGLFIGIPYVRLGHAAHLAGLAIGSAYVHYDGKRYIWRPARRLAFGGMKLLNMV